MHASITWHALLQECTGWPVSKGRCFRHGSFTSSFAVCWDITRGLAPRSSLFFLFWSQCLTLIITGIKLTKKKKESQLTSNTELGSDLYYQIKYLVMDSAFREGHCGRMAFMQKGLNWGKQSSSCAFSDVAKAWDDTELWCGFELLHSFGYHWHFLWSSTKFLIFFIHMRSNREYLICTHYRKQAVGLDSPWPQQSYKAHSSSALRGTLSGCRNHGLIFFRGSVNSTNHMESDPFGLGPLPYVVQDQTQVRVFAMQPQPEASDRNTMDLDVVFHWKCNYYWLVLQYCE